MCVCKQMADGGAIEDTDPPPATPTDCINCMLQKTQVRYWRKGLFGMLRSHQEQRSLRADISFLISNIRNAITTYQRGGNHSVIPINYDLKPDNIDLVNWRRVLVGMTLVLEEPDTNFEIRSISVSIGETTDSQCLHGMLIFLKALHELPLNLVHLVLNIDQTKGSILFETLTDTSMNFPISLMYVRHIRELYQANMEIMRAIGFYRRSEVEEITWTRPERRDYTKSLLYVLRGLLRGPSGVQPTS
ncbi:uncharacterized protein LOC132550360 [Ylistrum balloti]|uniref:uncharacterized protein LOC132550360 n=1 Tax=Ylistrum balloti TaxID=509963 RepID=UPI002905E790|nr:uncharacterized protein LOC132550360 [Ylistrum balloti]